MADRKARLAALAARAGRNNQDGENVENMVVGNNDDEQEDTAKAQQEQHEAAPIAVATSVQFRNYIPSDAAMAVNSDAGNTHSGMSQDEPSHAKKKTRTEQQQQPSSSSSKSALEEALEKAKKDVAPALVEQSDKNNNLTTMGPKKINWDLKRDIQQKMEMLERRTQRSIVHLLRERLEKEANEQLSDDASEELD